MARISLWDYARFTDASSPHHQAFWNAFDANLTPEQVASISTGGDTRSIWESAAQLKTATASAQALPQSIAAALPLIKEFEGCRLRAYPDPETGAEPWTIGWGSTADASGAPFRPGQTITQAEADALLLARVQRDHAQLAKRIPAWSRLSANQQAALLSFTYNCGVGWYGGSGFTTLTGRIERGELGQVPAALALYVNPGGPSEAGLRRRRAAEAGLWLSDQKRPAEPASAAREAPGRVRPGDPFSTRLTPNFTLGEFALGREERRFNEQHQVDTAGELAAFLERVRSAFGGKPVVITSGYRPASINRAVGGASSSEHLYNAPNVGAVDIYVKGADIKSVQSWCDQHWQFSIGYGAPKGFVHIGIRAGRPRVRWDY